MDWLIDDINENGPRPATRAEAERGPFPDFDVSADLRVRLGLTTLAPAFRLSAQDGRSGVALQADDCDVVLGLGDRGDQTLHHLLR
jgi:hypothetical protein